MLTAVEAIFSIIYQVKTSVEYKYGTIYREILKSRVEWCDFNDEVDRNPFFSNMKEVLQESAPALFHKCPYEVKTLKLLIWLI